MNYYYNLLKEKLGGDRSWRLTDQTSYPIGCTSETHRCTVLTIEFKGKHHFIEVNKDNSIEDIEDFNKLKEEIRIEEEKLKEEKRILHKNLDIGNELEKHQFVFSTWPSYDKDGLLETITLKNFSIDFQNDLIELLKKYE